MKRIFFNLNIFTGILIYIFMSCSEDPISDTSENKEWLPIIKTVNGSLSSTENMRVLKLFGSHYEIGYAHGYLLGPEIFNRQESNLAKEGLLDFYVNQVLPNINQVHFPDEYYKEIHGMYDGVKARTPHDTLYSNILGRYIDYNDAIALNCLNAFASQGMCSSISIWGNMTEDSTVLTAYNHDCLISDGHTGQWYVIVRVPNEASGAIPMVCIGLAGDMNVHTGMNLNGVTLSCQAINTSNPSTSTTGFTSEGIIFRKLIESVSAESPVEEIENVLNVLYGIEAEAVMMSWPNPVLNTNAVALEIDGNLADNHGFTIRYPENNNPYMIQTNHFLIRYTPLPCARYNDIQACLDSVAMGEKPPLSVDTAWRLLSLVRNGGDFLTEIAVVFEPEKKQMHVALAEPGIHAHECTIVILDIESLTAV
ncbi:hypothetical protein ACFLSX_01060 [Calditrichota bacterium]